MENQNRIQVDPDRRLVQRASSRIAGRNAASRRGRQQPAVESPHAPPRGRLNTLRATPALSLKSRPSAANLDFKTPIELLVQSESLSNVSSRLPFSTPHCEGSPRFQSLIFLTYLISRALTSFTADSKPSRSPAGQASCCYRSPIQRFCRSVIQPKRERIVDSPAKAIHRPRPITSEGYGTHRSVIQAFGGTAQGDVEHITVSRQIVSRLQFNRLVLQYEIYRPRIPDAVPDSTNTVP